MSGWQELTLQDIAAPSKNAMVGGPFGSDLVANDYVPEGVPVIRGQNLSEGRWVSGDFVRVSKEKAEKLRSNSAKAGDIIFTQRGANHYKQVAIVPDWGEPKYIISQSQMKMTVDDQVADPLFVFYLFQEGPQRDYLMTNAIATGVPHTNLGILRSVPILLPPLVEQKRIVRVIGALDDKIELNRRMSATLEEMARALYRSWFVDFDPVHARALGQPPAHMDPTTAALFPDSFGPDGLPKGWEAGALADLIEFNPKERLPKGTAAPYLEMKALPTSGMSADAPYLREFTSGTKFRERDTLLARITPCLENGKTAVVDDLLGSEIGWGSTEFIVMRAKPGVSAALPYCIARDPDFRAEAIQTMTGSSGRQRADAKRISELDMAIAPARVHAAFSDLVSPMLDRVIAAGQEARSLAVLRDTLLPRLMSGELRIREAEKRVEEVV